MFKLVPIRAVRKPQNTQNSEDIFDQFFDSFFNDDMFTSLNKMEKSMRSFAVDVIDACDKYIIMADLPGFSKEQVKVEYIDQHLVISGIRDKDENEDDTINYVRRERSYSNVKRRFYVDKIDPNTISASFDYGVLTVTLEKRPISSESREIVIE